MIKSVNEEITKHINRRKYYFFLLKLWITHPLAWFFFIFFLFINSFLLIIFLPLYYTLIIYWFFNAFKIIRKKEGLLKVKELNSRYTNVFINYFWTETIWKAYLLSYLFVYNCLKKKYNNDKTSINVFFIIFLNFLIKQLTGFSKKILIDSFNISLKFRKWEGWVHFYNSWFFDLIPIVAKNYLNIETHKIYFEKGIIKFNPWNNKFLLNKKIYDDIDYIANKEKKIFENLYINLEMLKRFTYIKNLQIENIKSYHMSFICEYYQNNNCLVSTITTNNNFKKNCVFIFKNNFTGVTSYISEPKLLNINQTKEVQLTKINNFSTRYLLKEEQYINLFLISLIINNNYEINIKTNNLNFKDTLKETFNDLNQINNEKFKGITNYTKNLYFLTYIKLFNNSLYFNLLNSNKFEEEIIEITLNYP